MSFSTFTHQTRSELEFIDVDPKSVADQSTALVKEERAPTPDENPTAVKLQCAECSFMACAERMARHLRRHRGENPFPCPLCSYSTYNSVLYEEHVNIHKGIKPYQCKLCDYRSVSKKYIKKHESLHVTCDTCGYAARDVRLMRRHLRLGTCSAEDRHRCESCKKSFPTAACLEKHVGRHRPCPECGVGFPAVALRKHRRRAHGVKKNEKDAAKISFKCGLCPFESTVQQKILLHLIHHPRQQLDPAIDVTPLVKAGIL